MGYCGVWVWGALWCRVVWGAEQLEIELSGVCGDVVRWCGVVLGLEVWLGM